MLIPIRIILGLTASSVGFCTASAVGSCMGQRNCETTLAASLFWAILVSAPFVISIVTVNGQKAIKSIINLICLAIITAYIYFLSYSTASPWNPIRILEIIMQWRSIDFITFLFVVLPPALVHASLICMVCIAPNSIRNIKERAPKVPFDT